MAAINFPASPSPGDKYPITGSIGGKVWSWDGTSWNIVSTNGSVTIIDDTARSFSFTVTYTNVAGNYNVVGTDRNGEVNGLNPTITVNEEDTLIFNVNATGHPFYVVWSHGGSSDQVGGGQGVNTASNQGTVNGTVTWVTDVGDGVALPQGGLFYYQCGNHPSMYGTIKVLLKKTSDSATHIHDLIDLDDTPNAYDNGKYLKSTATGTEWSTVTSGTTYDVVDDQADGLAPQLPASHGGKFLKADGTWEVPPDTDTNTTYNVVSTTADGLAPQLPDPHGGKFLKADGSWEVPAYSTIPNTFTTAAAGLVPITPGGTAKFLRADGSWQVPAGSSGTVAAEIDQWEMTTGMSSEDDQDGQGNPTIPGLDGRKILNNIVNDSNTSASVATRSAAPFAKLGNGMSVDTSGLWTFPTVGKWEVTFTVQFQASGSASGGAGAGNESSTVDIYIETTTDNGANWSNAAQATGQTLRHFHGGKDRTSQFVKALIDVTAVGTHKIRFKVNATANGTIDSGKKALMTFVKADASGGGGGGTADGNDYITSATLGTGADAKKLTLGFTTTSLNQIVDLSSINTDTDTTYNVVDATADGLAPQLPASHGGKYLRADGSWEVPPDTDTDTNTTYDVVSTSANGLAPQLPGSSTGKYLKDDGTWEVPPDTDTDTTYEIKALANNNDFNIQIDASGSGTDSSVRFEKGNNITLDVINSGHIKISATDNNTTYSNFNTSDAGLVPVSPGGTTKYLRADGTWQEVSGGGSADGNDYVTNLSLSGTTLTASFATTSLNQTVDLASINTDTDTTYNVVSISADGLAPTLPASGGSTQYLRGDGTWQTPPDTDTTYSNFNTSDAGLVPVSPGGTTKYLRADGTWQTVTSGGSDGNDYVTNLSLSGTTLTASFATTSLNQTVDLASINTDTNTTYNVVSTSADGLAPQLPSSHGGKYLRADGSWQVPPDTDTDTNTNYYANDFTYDNSTKVLSIGYAGNTSLDTTVTINPSGGGDIPSGTAMLFFQGSAPTGWSATGSYNDHAIRVVGSGGGGTGGSVGFTSAFSNHTVSISDSDTVSVGGSVTISGNCGGTQVMYVTTTQAWLTTDQIPSHNHQYHNPIGTSGGQHGFMDTTNSGSSGQPNTLSTGGSNYHTHAIIMYYISGSNFSFEGTDSWSDSDTVSISGSDDVDLRVKYVNAIVCTKD